VSSAVGAVHGLGSCCGGPIWQCGLSGVWGLSNKRSACWLCFGMRLRQFAWLRVVLLWCFGWGWLGLSFCVGVGGDEHSEGSGVREKVSKPSRVNF